MNNEECSRTGDCKTASYCPERECESTTTAYCEPEQLAQLDGEIAARYHDVLASLIANGRWSF